MSRTMIRRVTMLLMAAIVGFAVSIAQTIVNHTVDRGETLESIAQKYGTTKAKLIELNPDAAQMIYVGMVLKVPSQGGVVSGTTGTGAMTQSYSSAVSYDDDFARWEPVIQVGYGFLAKPKGTKDNCYSLNATVGVNYNITEQFYAGARLGYNSGYYFSKAYNASATYHFITIPIEAGYKFELGSEKYAIIPYGGFDFNICVKGSMESGTGSSKDKMDLKCGGKTGVDFRVGVRARVWSFNVGGACVVPLTDNQKLFFGDKAYPEVSIGWGF